VWQDWIQLPKYNWTTEFYSWSTCFKASEINLLILLFCFKCMPNCSFLGIWWHLMSCLMCNVLPECEMWGSDISIMTTAYCIMGCDAMYLCEVDDSGLEDFMFCWPCISIYACNETNLMHYFCSVYSITIPLHVSGLLVAHHQEVTICCMYTLLHPDDGQLASLEHIKV
jgi:hypothetical protein